MVPNLTKGRGIKGTALYVLHDERTLEEKAIGAEYTPDYQTAERVGFTATRNLSTDDAGLAWRLMCQTAKERDQLKQAAGVHKGGREAKYQCGHLSLSWEHGAKPDAAEMQRAAEGALTALGWEKLQALIVEHKDHEHAHCHIVVNLVDPETGKIAPNIKNDHEVLQRWAHDYEQETGRVVCRNRAERYAAQEQAEQRDQVQQAERRKWLPRHEWEAQRRAEREATQREQADQRAASLAEAKAQIREKAAEQREQHRKEWADLYKRHRQEDFALEKRDQRQDRELARAIKNPEERAAYFNRHAAELWQAHGEKKFATTEALLAPSQLHAATEKAQATRRAEQEARHAAEKAELAAKVEQARHEAQREIWKAHNERVKGKERDPEPTRPVSPAEAELKRYGDQRAAAAKARQDRAAGFARPDPAAEDPAKKTAADPARDSTRTDQQKAKPEPEKGKPANTNERDGYAEWLAMQRARSQRERERDRRRERER